MVFSKGGMRLVRRRGLAWREAAQKAAQTQGPASNVPKKDNWGDLLQQLKDTGPCEHPACRGNHKPGQPHQYDYAPIRRESRATAVQRAAEQEEEFRGFTNRLLVVLALLLAGLTGVVLYSLFSSPTFQNSSTPPSDTSD